MAHHKKRKRRKHGIKGCCGMCALRRFHGGLRNKRILTRQEERARLKEREQKKDYGS